MSDLPTTEPTADEMAAATAILARAAAARQAKVEAVMPALKTMVGDAAFVLLLQSATSVRDELPVEAPLYHHLNAMVTGMTNLQNDVAG